MGDVLPGAFLQRVCQRFAASAAGREASGREERGVFHVSYISMRLFTFNACSLFFLSRVKLISLSCAFLCFLMEMC